MSDLFIGILSGTSLNSIDAAVVRLPRPAQQAHQHNKHKKVEIIAAHNHPIPAEFKHTCLQITQQGTSTVDTIGELDQQAGVLFAEAVNALLSNNNIPAKQIIAIGSHGQTIRHCPNLAHPFSMQIADPNVIAQRTKITTIADFRRRDIAAGGQGAPLAPAFHAAMFRTKVRDRAIINIGGIANITFLSSDLSQPIIGFDVGPGNCLLDLWCQQHFNQAFDNGGKIAASGTIFQPLLQEMLADPFFALSAPKSTGREYFNADWLTQKIQHSGASAAKPADIQATITKLTSSAIANSISALEQDNFETELYLCGGGANNQAIIDQLVAQLHREVGITTDLGLAPEWVEAGLFAWLAQQCLFQLPGNVPSVTGATMPVVLGGVYL